MLRNFFIPTEKNNYESYLLKKATLVIYTIILLFVNYSPIFSFSISQVSADSITTEKLIQYTNEERESRGLKKLNANVKLTAAAHAKGNDMLDKQYWDHFGPDGETPWEFIKESGYNYIYAGENLAKGFNSSEGIHQAWMESPTHRDNILSGDYQDIGIAVINGKLQGEDTILIVQMFGNLTPETVETPNLKSSSQSIPESNSNENGQIKSIRIKNPQHESTIKDPGINISGEVNYKEKEESGQYTLTITDNQKNLGAAQVFDQLEWEFDSKKDLSEGIHEIEVIAKQNNITLKDNIQFTIDSNPPVIYKNSVKIKDNTEKNISFEVVVKDQDPQIELVLGNKNYNLNQNQENGYYSTDLSKETITNINFNKNTATIIASDSLGNITKLDVSEVFKNYLKSQDNGDIAEEMINSVRNTISFLEGFTIRDWINTVFIMVILALLMLEIYHYQKLEKLHYRAYSVFLVGIWWILLISGMVIGWGGSLG